MYFVENPVWFFFPVCRSSANSRTIYCMFQFSSQICISHSAIYQVSICVCVCFWAPYFFHWFVCVLLWQYRFLSYCHLKYSRFSHFFSPNWLFIVILHIHIHFIISLFSSRGEKNCWVLTGIANWFGDSWHLCNIESSNLKFWCISLFNGSHKAL